MKKNCKYKVGDAFTMTIPKFHTYSVDFRVIDTDIKDDGRGTIRLDYIQEREVNEKPINYLDGESHIIVEDQWFNEKLTGRITKKLKI